MMRGRVWTLAFVVCAAAWARALGSMSSPSVICNFDASWSRFVLRHPDSGARVRALQRTGPGDEDHQGIDMNVERLDPNKKLNQGRQHHSGEKGTSKAQQQMPSSRPRISSSMEGRFVRSSVKLPKTIPASALVWTSIDGAVHFVRVESRTKKFAYHWFEYHGNKLFAHFVETDMMKEPELRASLWDPARTMWIVLAPGQARWVSQDDPVEVHQSLPNLLFKGTFLDNGKA
ncbi:Hypothetical Protein FCC1311_056002 [Hondaea fermentalgiana]|uniref:von Hippel-Lindau disease tumour suppressor beta domain-containing protein n=1 Tax=Hondaea fermentalgiana TaxID=2315210 RepID=A0A2R5GI26_9STRA|nr:Hypothetical Protein FCC1311_056002 [Hondaea fermentalgiana]|eukprot:GBG29378.1 Hypothetical Protein FCC1311_056002 [Hondaea fermentalgiana]